jgi:CDP-diacylglycerol--serine O-phosphatidyltransferase
MPALRYFVPNSFTAASLLLGLASVHLSSQGDFRLAAWMILWATLLDKLDGTAARLCHATSSFGVQFDSFADFVGFGIAPAALVHYRLLATGDLSGSAKWTAMAAAGLYALALAVRLARFNVITSESDTVFQGVPGTLMGAVLASGYLAWDKYQLSVALLDYLPILLVASALLMVSSLRLPKLKKRKSLALNVFQFGNVAAAYVLGPLMLFPEYLFSLALSYLVGGLAVGAFASGEVEDQHEESDDIDDEETDDVEAVA